jgi:hypothetical protein
MPALLPIVLENLPTIVVGAEHLWAWVTSVREAAQQSGEWTDDHEAQFRAALLATGKSHP